MRTPHSLILGQCSHPWSPRPAGLGYGSRFMSRVQGLDGKCALFVHYDVVGVAALSLHARHAPLIGVVRAQEDAVLAVLLVAARA